jgi:hypothetical protein
VLVERPLLLALMTIVKVKVESVMAVRIKVVGVKSVAAVGVKVVAAAEEEAGVRPGLQTKG